MKKVLAIFSIMLGLLFHNSQAQSSKMFKIQISHIEKSKDSHTITETWNLKNGTLYYQKLGTGRMGKLKEQSEKKLTQDQINQIYELISKGDLYQNIPSPKYTEFQTPYNALKIHATFYKSHPAALETFDIQLYNLYKEMEKNEVYKNVYSVVILLNKILRDK